MFSKINNLIATNLISNRIVHFFNDKIKKKHAILYYYIYLYLFLYRATMRSIINDIIIIYYKVSGCHLLSHKILLI